MPMVYSVHFAAVRGGRQEIEVHNKNTLEEIQCELRQVIAKRYNIPDAALTVFVKPNDAKAVAVFSSPKMCEKYVEKCCSIAKHLDVQSVVQQGFFRQNTFLSSEEDPNLFEPSLK